MLEPRLLLASPGDIVPEQLYQDVAFTDSRGDTVEVSLSGPTSAATGFTLTLSGGAVDDADINTIDLLGVTARNNLIIQVTPNLLEITSGGQFYSQMFSAGYVNVTSITATADSNFPLAPAVTALGGIQLSAAVANSITLPGVNIGNIALDAGEVPYVDRVNSATLASISVSAPVVTASGGAALQEVVDESPVGLLASYTPCTGLIALNNIQAQSISSIVINGATPLSPNNAFDAYDTMNDFEGTINVGSSIGSIVGPNSAYEGNGDRGEHRICGHRHHQRHDHNHRCNTAVHDHAADGILRLLERGRAPEPRFPAKRSCADHRRGADVISDHRRDHLRRRHLGSGSDFPD